MADADNDSFHDKTAEAVWEALNPAVLTHAAMLKVLAKVHARIASNIERHYAQFFNHYRSCYALQSCGVKRSNPKKSKRRA